MLEVISSSESLHLGSSLRGCYMSQVAFYMSKFIGSYREGESAMMLKVMQLQGRVCRDAKSHAALSDLTVKQL